jgi:SAM-dependent methyltransferase
MPNDAAPSNKELQIQLLLISILALFLELLVIRWLSTEIRVFAYFKNLPLMSAFLGMGLGFIWFDKKWSLYKWSAFGLLILCGLMICAFKLDLTYLTFVNPDQFMLFGTHMSNEKIASIRSLFIMLAIFALSTSIFIGLGQRMGKLFNELRPLQAYSINVFGGLIGTLLFSALCFLSLPPGAWLIAAGIFYFLIDKRPVSVAVVGLGVLYSVWAGPFITNETYGPDFVKTVWSPYYRIDVIKCRAQDGTAKGSPLGYHLYINYDSFQSIVDCTPAALAHLPEFAKTSQLAANAIAFQILSKPNQNVLILGSGSGSDVAAALRNGAGHIDAVEIDQQIANLGKEFHPEKPYDSDKVTLYITDARNYLKNCKKKYDVIVFAALDSHAAFSALSSLRMDNYVFTQESLKEASKLLTPDGIISVNFVIPAEFLWQRHVKALASALGYTPFAYRENRPQDTGMLFTGPGLNPNNLPAILAAKTKAPIDPNWPIPVATDDWPFLFLPKKEVPVTYILPILLVLLLSAIPVATQIRRGGMQIINWQMFTLGMAFMMLEVRAMADLSLLFGSTWIINSVIISSVMVVILLANWLAVKLSQKHIMPAISAVVLTLFITTFINVSDLNFLGSGWGALLGTTLFLVPLVFASITFALLFKNTKSSSTALAFNLFGGVIGICLEYLSMAVGIRALSWVGMGLYSLVLLMQFLNSRNSKAALLAEQESTTSTD